MADIDDGRIEEIPVDNDNDHVEEAIVGKEPGARNLDESLFATESFEDLSNEVVSHLDGQCSSRTVSAGSTGNDKDLVESSESNGSGEKEIIVENETESKPPETLNEVRMKRAESVQERQNSVEDMDDLSWKNHKKHIFILSEAGKPIYTRYGNEENLVTMMGLMQAIVSFVQDNKDNIRCVTAGKHKFVFLVRGPIILVAVCSAPDSQAQLIMQLTYVYHQVLSVLTFTQLTKIFEHRRNYDLRKLLSGTERFIDNLLNLMSHDVSFLLQAVRCLPISNTIRDIIGQALQSPRAKELLFAILVVDNQLVTMVRPKNFSLHPSDLHLIFNLVSGSTSFHTAESWTPICLPRFDNSGYLYAHVSYLQDDCPACLLLLSTDRNAFFELSECKVKILERMQKFNCIEHLTKAAKRGNYKTEQVGISELWHFIYKSRSTSQFTAPDIGPPYNTSEEQERLFGLYLHLHHRIHSSSRPLKRLYYTTSKEMLLGYVTAGFEIFACFTPLTSKATALNAINRLLRWIKKEEDILFILNSYTF